MLLVGGNGKNDPALYLFNRLLDKYNRGQLKKRPSVEALQNKFIEDNWLLELRQELRNALTTGTKVAARVEDAPSAGSNNAATVLVVFGVVLAVMLLAGVGYYVYKRWVLLMAYFNTGLTDMQPEAKTRGYSLQIRF